MVEIDDQMGEQEGQVDENSHYQYLQMINLHEMN